MAWTNTNTHWPMNNSKLARLHIVAYCQGGEATSSAIFDIFKKKNNAIAKLLARLHLYFIYGIFFPTAYDYILPRCCALLNILKETFMHNVCTAFQQKVLSDKYMADCSAHICSLFPWLDMIPLFCLSSYSCK